jgi:hypothetical protein|tara:strand:+ start:1279 stop:1635 length:357 start_codon:yes stop_codon:yes gene_type:complete
VGRSIILQKFSNLLEEISYPSDKKSSWHIQGRLKQSNQIFKFDVRNMFELNSSETGKYINLGSQAEKVVFEFEDEWVILDMKEFNNYINKNKLKKVHLKVLLSKLDWSIIIPKQKNEL